MEAVVAHSVNYYPLDEVTKRVTGKWYPDLLEGIYKLTVPGLIDTMAVDVILIPWYVRASGSDSALWIIYLPNKQV